MVQRFSDITIMFAGLWLVCEASGLSFLYMHLLVALITLVVFQMLGGITDFYRSWRGVRAATEFALLLQSGLSFLYMHLLVALITLVVFQMLGGITDFYRSWRGVRAATEFALLLQNWTLSVIFSAGLVAFNNDFDTQLNFSAGLVAFNNDFDTQLKIWLAWYGLTSIGLVVCRSCIRIGAGWLRNQGWFAVRVFALGRAGCVIRAITSVWSP